jgi:hypothetical protein
VGLFARPEDWPRDLLGGQLRLYFFFVLALYHRPIVVLGRLRRDSNEYDPSRFTHRGIDGGDRSGRDDR